MRKNEQGMTLVEVLAVLVLVSLVTGVIWTTISIATKFNMSETSYLKLQQEANYIISELQQVHRHCETYRLTINPNEVKVSECMKNAETPLEGFNGVISTGFHYKPIIDNELIEPTKGEKDINNLTVSDVTNNLNREPREVVISTVLSRYITEEQN